MDWFTRRLPLGSRAQQDDFPPSRFAALRRALRAEPARYARTRNHLDGAVTALSPLHHEDLLDFPDRTDLRADLVLAADVFIYVGALEAMCPAVRRVLAPGCCFAFTVEAAPDTEDYRLQPGLRYAHSGAYIRRLAAACGFAVRTLRRAPLRKNLSEPLDALYAYLEVPAQ